MTAAIERVRSALTQQHPGAIVTELLAAYTETRRNHFLGGHRLSAVEGGRFTEAAVRMLQQHAMGTHTPFSKKIDIDRVMGELASNAPGLVNDTLRLHIPRALRVIYDVRNNRNAAHIGSEVDPSAHDSMLVVSISSWVLAEFYRLSAKVHPDEARGTIEMLTRRGAPAVQDFDGFLKVLRTDLTASECLLLLLYEREDQGATLAELRKWVFPSMRANLSRTLQGLVHTRAFVHIQGGKYVLTGAGVQEVERLRLHLPPELY